MRLSLLIRSMINFSYLVKSKLTIMIQENSDCHYDLEWKCDASHDFPLHLGYVIDFSFSQFVYSCIFLFFNFLSIFQVLHHNFTLKSIMTTLMLLPLFHTFLLTNVINKLIWPPIITLEFSSNYLEFNIRFLTNYPEKK